MKQLLCLLAVLCCVASAATAGPNVGGVLWVHDTGILYSTDMQGPQASPPPADCPGVDNEQPLDGMARIWKVYAAFPAGSSPRLKGTGWGIEFPEAAGSPTAYVSVIEAGCGFPDQDGPGTDFGIMNGGFPKTSGGEIGQGFPAARLTTVVELYYFSGYGVGGPATFGLKQHSFDRNRVFTDDATPENEDAIAGYGSLGFGQAGTTPCPSSDPDAACCTPVGTCTLTKQADCSAPNVWHREWYACVPNPCPPPTGACCYTDGRCQLPTEAQCSNGGGTYLGDGLACTPNPCPPAAACCLASGSCLVRTEAACGAFSPSGTWFPESASCDPSPCSAPPTGSCCLPNGSCLVQSQAACTGDWTLSGTCEPNLCPAPDVEGACCSLQAACTLTRRADCAELSVWHAEWDTCDPNPCPTPVRACCSPNGECTLTTEIVCDLASIWHGELTSCDPNLCPNLPTEPSSWGQIKNRFR